MGGIQRQRQKVVNFGSIGQAPGSHHEVSDRLVRMAQHQMRTAAEQAHFTVLGGQVHGLVEPRERLIGLVAQAGWRRCAG